MDDEATPRLMPFTVSVALLKGGVSKTTTAIALGEAAALSVPTIVIDTDPMGSARRWAMLAEQSGRPLGAEVISLPTADLPRLVGPFGHRAGVVIIDTPPPGALDVTRSAIQLADVTVMPVTPNAADLDRVQATAAIASQAGRPASAVLVQVRGGIEDAALAAVTLRSWGVPVYSTELPLTVAVQRAYGQALPSGPLLRFGIDLMTEIAKEADI